MSAALFYKQSNYIDFILWDEFIYSFPNLNVQPVKFGNG